MNLLLGLLLAASIDGEAALRHASALAALGPHPWGSPRAEAAARYVEAQLREAGLTEVSLQGFERHGIRGTNVVGTLRGPSDEMLVVAAHHDTAPGSPGAYDDGGGVGLLVELARAMVDEPSRTRTVVFVSFDGEEAWSTGRGRTAGSRAWLERLGPDARRLVAALVIEMAGWTGGAPVLHPIAYADPKATGRSGELRGRPSFETGPAKANLTLSLSEGEGAAARASQLPADSHSTAPHASPSSA